MSESYITHQEIGQALLARRLEGGFTLADVASATNLRTFFLMCMEEGKFNELPGGIYTRGLSKLYIMWLGFDDEQCEVWLNQIERPRILEKKSPAEPISVIRTFPVLWGVSCVAVIVVAWLYVSRSQPSKENTAFVVESSATESHEKGNETAHGEKSLALLAHGDTWIKITDSDSRIVYAQLIKKDATIDLSPYVGKKLAVGDGRQVVLYQKGVEVGRLSDPSEENNPVLVENIHIQADTE